MSLMKYLLIAILFLASCSDGNNVPDDKDDDGNEAGKDSTIIVPPTDTLGHNDTSAVITLRDELLKSENTGSIICIYVGSAWFNEDQGVDPIDPDAYRIPEKFSRCDFQAVAMTERLDHLTLFKKGYTY